MSIEFVEIRELCIKLDCEKWFLKCLTALYGLRELGHSDTAIYLMEDVKASLVAHAADGRPTKTEMERKIKASGAEKPKTE